VQSHRLQPSQFAGQRAERWAVGVEGAVFGSHYTDAAGDRVRTMTRQGPLEELEIVVEGVVATADTSGVLRGHAERVPPLAYLRDTAATAPDDAIRDLAAGAASGEGPALDRAHALSDAVADALAYRTGATDAGTTAAEALAAGAGVCQDHAHLLIAAARAAGLPARYVTGYLHVEDQADDTPREAAHAWAELHVEGLGWVGFDPANRCCPDARYVRLGSGLDAQAAAPVRGASFGISAEDLDVAVAVEAVQQ